MENKHNPKALNNSINRQIEIQITQIKQNSSNLLCQSAGG